MSVLSVFIFGFRVVGVIEGTTESTRDHPPGIPFPPTTAPEPRHQGLS